MVAKQVRKMYYILLTLPWKQRVLGLIPKKNTYLLLTQIFTNMGQRSYDYIKIHCKKKKNSYITRAENRLTFLI